MRISAIIRTTSLANRGRVLTRGVVFAVCSVLIGGMASCGQKVDDSTVGRISVTEVARQLEKGSNVLILDARDTSSYDSAHIPDARHVSLPDVEPYEPTPAFEGYSSIIVYGENPSSGTAMALAKRLQQAKHKNVQLMQDGFVAWTAQGLPVVKGK